MHDQGALAADLDAAEVLQEAGQLEAARTAFAAVGTRAREAGDVDTLAAAAVGLGGTWVHEQRTSIARAHMLELQRAALGGRRPGVGDGLPAPSPAGCRGVLRLG